MLDYIVITFVLYLSIYKKLNSIIKYDYNVLIFNI